MNNAYLKDIIKHDSVYQGVITPNTPINFYSLCKKVFEKASDGPHGNARAEIYKLTDFEQNAFEAFFDTVDSAKVEEINNMLHNSTNQRRLEFIFIGYAYLYSYTVEEDTATCQTFYMPINFTLNVDNDGGTKSFSVQLAPLIEGEGIPQDAKIGGDLILKAYGDAEF